MPALTGAAVAEVMRLATAYQASRALHVAVRMGIPDLLVDEPRSVEDVAAIIGAHAPSLRRLMRALVAFDVLVEQPDGYFGLGALGECLRTGVPGSVRALVSMWGDEDFWRSWGALEHGVRTGETAAKHLFGTEDAFARYAADARFGPVFNAAMTTMSAMAAMALVSAYDFSGVARIVDVGGGQGRLLAEILRANPNIRGVLLDLPAVVASAPALLAETGVTDRCEVVDGDMFAAVPAGGDLYLLKSIIHDWDDAYATAILTNCRRAMAEHGRLLLIERMLPEYVVPTPEVRSIALSDLNMLVRTGGRERTVSEFRALLSASGLRLVRVVATAMTMSVLEAIPTQIPSHPCDA